MVLLLNASGAAACHTRYCRGRRDTISRFHVQSAVALSCLSTPLSPGNSGTVYVSLYGTGIRGAGTVQAYVGGNSVPVSYAGPQGQYQGLDQVNISLPVNLVAGAWP